MLQLFEMAFDKREYQRKVDDLMDQIAQNWCLCKFCQITDPNNYNYNGWKKELRAYLYKIRRFKVKGDKFKWTKEVIIDKAEFNDFDVVRKACEYKLDDETDLNISEEEKQFLFNEFILILSNLIECLSGEISIQEFFKSI